MEPSQSQESPDPYWVYLIRIQINQKIRILIIKTLGFSIFEKKFNFTITFFFFLSREIFDFLSLFEGLNTYFT